MTNVAKPTPEHDRANKLAELPRTLMGGTRAMRAAGERYLPRFASETVANYSARLHRSTSFNAFKKTVADMTGRVFIKPIAIGKDVPEELVGFAENIDLTGRHLNVFARDVFYDCLQTGIGYILTDAPPAPVRTDGLTPTVADYQGAGWRPYLVFIPVENLIGWKSTTVDGSETLTQIRIKECVSEPDGDFAEKTVDQIRVIEPARWQTWRKSGQSGAWEVFAEGPNGLGKIAIAPVYLNRTGFMTGEPPLQDLADLNVAHWQSQSDQRNILTVARVPILFGTGIEEQVVLEIGASSMVRVSNPDAKLSYVEHTGAAIAAGDKDLQNLQFQMQACGLQLLVPDPGRTATGEIRDDVKENSTLAYMVAALQDALELSFGFLAEYAGLGDDKGGSLAVNTEFGISGNRFDIQYLTQAVIAGMLDDQTYIDELKRRGALSDAVDTETVLHRIDAAGGSMNLLTH
ncbi:DUF4055 domain-containing protein [Bradyrhizobium sp. McL0616]|uniref:DUF4055 domain-containing protein n=1 Tax=Bradyrhizobium sp. McL0616 TaxID=3415674 RepID=UPI003CE76D2F